GKLGELSFRSRISTSTRKSCRGFSVTTCPAPDSTQLAAAPHRRSRSSCWLTTSAPLSRRTAKWRRFSSEPRRSLRPGSSSTFKPRSRATFPTTVPTSVSSTTE
ncbi:hypothetical protein N335_05468, partial [Phaethon lepturus]